VPCDRGALQRFAHRRAVRRRQPARSAGGRGRRGPPYPRAHREGQEDPLRGQAAGDDRGLPRFGVRGAGAVLTVFLRSLAFAPAQAFTPPPYSILALATFPLPRLARYRIISGWSRVMIWLAKVVLGIRYRVIGTENLPRNPAVILSKHQSTWETLAF